MCVLICLPQLKRYTKCDKLDPFFSGVFLSKGLFRNNIIIFSGIQTPPPFVRRNHEKICFATKQPIPGR